MSSSYTTSTSKTTSKTYASGAVDKNTQANKNKYAQEYKQSQQVNDIYNRLNTHLNKQPGPFSSAAQGQLDAIYNKIMNREPFSYDFNADPVYQQYKANYINTGKNAMKDTVAQTTALTGGYSNSYAQTAGQQTYQQYLQELNNVIPQLEQQKYQRYKDEGDQLQNQYGLASDRYTKDYQLYRDNVADWRSDRDYLTNYYNNERNFDYGQYTANRQYWNDEYWKQKNSASTTESTTTQTSTTVSAGGGGGGGGGGGRGGSSSSSSSSTLKGKDLLLANVKKGKNKEAQQSLLDQYVKRGDQTVADLRWVAQQLGLKYYGKSSQVTGSGGHANKNLMTIM